MDRIETKPLLSKSIEITEQELVIIKLVRRLQPYGKLEVALNQNGSLLTILLTNPEKTTIEIKKA